eukprot:35062_1
MLTDYCAAYTRLSINIMDFQEMPALELPCTSNDNNLSTENPSKIKYLPSESPNTTHVSGCPSSTDSQKHKIVLRPTTCITPEQQSTTGGTDCLPKKRAREPDNSSESDPISSGKRRRTAGPSRKNRNRVSENAKECDAREAVIIESNLTVHSLEEREIRLARERLYARLKEKAIKLEQHASGLEFERRQTNESREDRDIRMTRERLHARCRQAAINLEQKGARIVIKREPAESDWLAPEPSEPDGLAPDPSVADGLVPEPSETETETDELVSEASEPVRLAPERSVADRLAPKPSETEWLASEPSVADELVSESEIARSERARNQNNYEKVMQRKTGRKRSRRRKRPVETNAQRKARRRECQRARRAARKLKLVGESTNVQRESSLKRQRECQRVKRESETAEKREARLKRDRERTRAKREAQTPEERELRRKRERERMRAKRAAETPEQRELRNKRERESKRIRDKNEKLEVNQARMILQREDESSKPAEHTTGDQLSELENDRQSLRVQQAREIVEKYEAKSKKLAARQARCQERSRIEKAKHFSGKSAQKLAGEAQKRTSSTDTKLFDNLIVGQVQPSDRKVQPSDRQLQPSDRPCFECDFCTRRFTTERARLQHTYRHTGEKHFQCETCGRRFISGPTLQYHQRKCGSTRFQCKQCPLSFRFRQDFELHEFTHLIPSETNDTALSIDVSGFQVETQKKSELKYLNQVPPSQSNDTWCSICRIQYSSLSALRNHAPIHSGSSKFKCVFCPKVFDGKLNFVQHTRNHTNKWPYACAKCGAGFNSKWLLTNHLKFHSEKSSDVVCQTCHKSFKSTVSLLIHMNKHKIDQGIVMNQCEFCNKSFMSKNVLRTHLRLHTGERPYLCSRCGLRFSFRSYLNKHKCAAEKHDLK